MINLREICEKSKFHTKYPHLLQYNIELKEFTSFKIGGSADIYINPSSVEELCSALTFLQENHIPALLLGGCSNILVCDERINGAVIHTTNLKGITLETIDGEPVVTANAGATMEELMAFCKKNKLSGLEDFAGLPGTVGGAIFMNARCYDTEIADKIISISVLKNEQGTYLPHTYILNPKEWSYKHSPFQTVGKNLAEITDDRPIIAGASFKTAYGSISEIEQKMNARAADRTEKEHYKLPSAGSAFKNNRAFGKPSGKLIDEAGLRGIKIGGAQVAPWHGNFIINTGSASAADVRALMQKVQEEVKKQSGYVLEPEIIFASL